MNKDKSVGSICSDWWQRTFGRDDGIARMARAKLRRCTTPVEVFTIECVHELHRLLRNADYRPSPDQLALVSIALAHVDRVGEDKLATLFGRRVSKNAPQALSALRFQRLIQTNDRIQLIAPLRRSMAIVRRSQINIVALSTDLYYWNENTKNIWCFQYFGASITEPDINNTGDQLQ